MRDDLLKFPDQDRTITGGLRRYFEYRSVAEMSIWFSIAALAGLIGIVLAGLVLAVLVGIEKATGIAILVGLALWLGCLGWLWVTFVRIARGWGTQRLGTPIFRYMQIAFLALTALTMLARGVLFRQQEIFFLTLLAFDNIIVGMIFVFLLLAWFARCKVPWRTYGEVLAMTAMFVAEVFLTKPWSL